MIVNHVLTVKCDASTYLVTIMCITYLPIYIVTTYIPYLYNIQYLPIVTTTFLTYITYHTYPFALVTSSIVGREIGPR
jgi:hypothetical protein